MAAILLRHSKARWQTGLVIWLRRGSKKYICSHIRWRRNLIKQHLHLQITTFQKHPTTNQTSYFNNLSIFNMSGLLNKVKSAVSGEHGSSTTHSTTTSTTHHPGHNTSLPEGTVGSHNSRVANAADPRIDSDLDSSRQTGIGHSTHNQTSGLNSSVGAHSSRQSHVPATGNHSQTTAGVHNSNILNKADPTIDSDLSGGNHLGAQSNARTAGFSSTGSSSVGGGETFPAHHVGAGVHTGNTNNPALPHVGGSSGLNSSTHNTSTHTGTISTAGPHSSNLLNKADPRVDSDRSNVGHSSHVAGSGLSGSTHNTSSGLPDSHNTSSGLTSSTHGASHSSNAGPHSSNMANVADPR